ncbi:MAG: polysaccharide deacetylase [Oscillospiraceae bacterium]|nr:polysaccharide deacetylase [Oscillospiraceae bacterium]
MYVVLQRKHVFVFLIAVLSAFGLLVGMSSVIGENKSDERLPAFAHSHKVGEYKIYLTFDDGPSPTTDKVLDVLKEHEIKGTFFVIGPEDNEPSIYNRIIDEGHSMGLHSFSHKTDIIYRTSQEYIEDFERLRDYIFKQTGTIPDFCRMVGGSNSRHCTKRTRQEIVNYFTKNGYKCYDWDIDPKDSGAYALSAVDIAQNIINEAQKMPDRDLVILLHDDKIRKTLPDALKIVIPYFIEQGYEFSTLSANTVLNGSSAAVN